MNMDSHFRSAELYLEMGNEKVSRQDYAGARASITKAHEHTRELLEHVVKLEVLKANIEHSD